VSSWYPHIVGDPFLGTKPRLPRSQEVAYEVKSRLLKSFNIFFTCYSSVAHDRHIVDQKTTSERLKNRDKRFRLCYIVLKHIVRDRQALMVDHESQNN
jgi:hypothetical protein